MTLSRAGESQPRYGGAEHILDVIGGEVRIAERTIWSDVSLTVQAGEFVAVLGANGAGKSTLIKAILGLVPLASGHMMVLGRSPKDARRDIGYLPQRRSFDPSVRIRGVDIVRLGLEGARWGVPLPGGRRWSERGRSDDARIEEVVGLVGASEYAGKPIGLLSGGEQQRLLIAQALVRRPRLLLLDEPLDSLDLPNQTAVAALLSRICRTENVSTLLVTHDVNPVIAYLDTVVYLAGGRAVSGPVEDVVTTGTLSRLYGTSVEVIRTSEGRLIVVGQPEPPAVHSDRHHH